MGNLGNVKIFFGKVTAVLDETKMYRIQVSIPSYTDKIELEKLPWYFPWYGIKYLPVIDDILPVIIFDGNFATGFYGSKVNVDGSAISEDDYENYLEIFKRLVNDKQITLGYTVTEGILFQNGDNMITIGLEMISFMFAGWGITIEDGVINIGSGGTAALLGDKTVEHLHAIIAHQNATITEFGNILQAMLSACVTPFTAPISAAGMPLLTAGKTKLMLENTKIDKKTDMLQSEKIFIE